METSTSREMIDEYEVIRPLKSGGMGEVLLALNTIDGQRVAIKRPFASANSDHLRRFKIEGKAEALKNDNIAEIYRAGNQQNGRPYLAMEYVDGFDVRELIAPGKPPLDLLLILTIVKQVCDGLAYAHRRGFFHRDIKPANVMIPKNAISQREGEVVKIGKANIVAKIVDFGIAKMTNAELQEQSQDTGLVGSAPYIAPERYTNKPADGRVDIFSTGVMLYLLLTERLPFAGASDTTIQRRIVNEGYASLGEAYPPALDDILNKALAKNPDKRFATAEDFRDELVAVIGAEKQLRVTRFVDEAESLIMKALYQPARELLTKAHELDEENTQVIKLGKFLRVKEAEEKTKDEIRTLIAKADRLEAQDYTEKLNFLNQALSKDENFPDLKDRIASLEVLKRRQEGSIRALIQIEAAITQGDVVRALDIAEEALLADPENRRIVAQKALLTKYKIAGERLDAAWKKWDAKDRNIPEIEELLARVAEVVPRHPKLKELRDAIQQERHLRIVGDFTDRVNNFLQAGNYEEATNLLDRAIEANPRERFLLELKAEVDAAKQFESKLFVEDKIAAAGGILAEGDPDKALETLRQAISERPTEKRLVDEERALRQKAEIVRAQKKQIEETLFAAGMFIEAGEFEQAIAELQSYSNTYGDQEDVRNLLAETRGKLAAQQLQKLVDQAMFDAESLAGKNRLGEAIQLLESTLGGPATAAPNDAPLSALLDGLRAQQRAAAQKLQLALTRAGEHRKVGNLDEAIHILEEYAKGASLTPEVQKHLSLLRVERQERLSSLEAKRKRELAIAKAIEAAKQASAEFKFTAALERLQAEKRVYSDSKELTQTIQEVQQARDIHAQQVVGRGIEVAENAMRNNDVAAALAALYKAKEMLEFADAVKQARWREIEQEAKKRRHDPAPPVAKLKRPLILGLGIGAVCVALAAAGFVIYYKLFPPPTTRTTPTASGTTASTPPVQPPPVVDTQATINIVKAPPETLISLNGGPTQKTDANGSLSLTQIPRGEYVVTAKKDGYEPFAEKLQIVPGPNALNIPMIKTVVTATSGSLMMVSTITGFKVIVNGQQRPGEFPGNKGTISLDQGTYTIQYSNEDGSSTIPPHKVKIVAGESFTDKFKLDPPLPPSGNLIVITGVPNASISVDRQAEVKADGAGNLTIKSLSAATHTVVASADQYVTASAPVTVLNGKSVSIPLTLKRQPPPLVTTGTLSITTTEGAQVSVNGVNGTLRGTADGLGNLSVPNLAQGKYTVDLSLPGYQKQSEPAIISPGVTEHLTAKLTRLPPPPPSKIAPDIPAAPDHAKDIQDIKTAFNKYQKTVRDRGTASQLKAVYLNQPTEAHGWPEVLKAAYYVNISENPLSLLEFSPDGSATQTCDETVYYTEGGKGVTSRYKFIFEKKDDKWVLRSRKNSD